MKSRKAFLIAIATALLIGTTVSQAQSAALTQEMTVDGLGTRVLTRADGMYVLCTTCGYVKQFTERNDVPNAPANSLAALKNKLAGKPNTHQDVVLTISRPGNGTTTTLTIDRPQIQLHLGDLVYVAPNGDVRLIHPATAANAQRSST